MSLACQKPKELGYSYELWTTRLLAEHIRKHCLELGFDSLAKLSRGTVSKISSENKIKPHKIQYYLERRDPEFDQKMIQVLHVYPQHFSPLPSNIGITYIKQNRRIYFY